MKMLRKSAVAEKSGYSIATIYRRVASGLWTKPVQISPQCSAWPEHEVDALLAAVVAGTSDDGIRTLVARLHVERGAGKQHDEQWRKASRAMRALAKRSVEQLVQASPKTAKAFLRVEFNPFKNPMAEVHAMLNFIVPGGYSAFLAKSKLTRTDIAIDVHMVRPGQLLVTHQGFQTGNTFAKSGTVTGYVVGTKGSARHFIVYDKQLQLKKQNTKSPWKVLVPDHAVTRIEAQLKVDLPTSHIATLPNPFAKLAVADFGSIKANDDYTKLLLLAALGTGAQTALAAVSAARRKVFKQQLSDAVPTWWSPADCWQAWPEEVKKVLVPPPAAYDLSFHKKTPPAMGSHLAH